MQLAQFILGLAGAITSCLFIVTWLLAMYVFRSYEFIEGGAGWALFGLASFGFCVAVALCVLSIVTGAA